MRGAASLPKMLVSECEGGLLPSWWGILVAVGRGGRWGSLGMLAVLQLEGCSFSENWAGCGDGGGM